VGILFLGNVGGDAVKLVKIPLWGRSGLRCHPGKGASYPDPRRWAQRWAHGARIPKGGNEGSIERVCGKSDGQVPISPVKMDSDGAPFWFW